MRIALIIIAGTLGISTSYASEAPRKIYACGSKKSPLTLELTDRTASLSGETGDGRLVDVMGFKRTFKQRQKNAKFDLFQAGKSYAPVAELLIEKPLRKGAPLGRLEVKYKDGTPADHLKCRKVAAEPAADPT